MSLSFGFWRVGCLATAGIFIGAILRLSVGIKLYTEQDIILEKFGGCDWQRGRVGGMFALLGA